MALSLSIAIVVLTAAGQLLLKLGATGTSGLHLVNKYVLAGYLLFFATVLASYYLMHVMAMKNFTVLMSLSYVAVALGARFVLKEEISRRRALGTLLIVAGVSVFLMN